MNQVQFQWMQWYQPYDQSWNGCYQLHDKWINYSTNVFQKMECCVICGLVKLNHQWKHYLKND
jgi:hypothetical protein